MKLFLLLATLLTPHAFAEPSPWAETMCRSPVDFRSCYQATEAECLRSATAAVDECMRQIPKLPDNLGNWGVAIGRCAEAEYHRVNQAAFQSSSPDCTKLLNERLARGPFHLDNGAAASGTVLRSPLFWISIMIFGMLLMGGFVVWLVRRKSS